MRPLYKTTIVIWSETHPQCAGRSVEELGRDCMNMDACCSRYDCTFVEHPDQDPEQGMAMEFFSRHGHAYAAHAGDSATPMRAVVGDECPNCHSGTVVEEEGERRCAGECGAVLSRDSDLMKRVYELSPDLKDFDVLTGEIALFKECWDALRRILPDYLRNEPLVLSAYLARMLVQIRDAHVSPGFLLTDLAFQFRGKE